MTNFGKQVIDWYWTRQSEVYIFAETHLDPQKHQQTCQYFTARGRTACGTPAWPNEDNSGTHTGILMLEWLKQGQAKGLRGLFRSLKSCEVAWERPYTT